MSWPKIKKIVLKCRILTRCNNSKPFLDWIMTCDKNGILYNNQLSGWTKKLQSTSQSQTCTKKGHGHCLVICCWSDPWKLSESQWNHYIWEVCLAHWWDAWRREWLYPLQYSCLGNSMGREVWWATVHGVAKSGHNWATFTHSFTENCNACNQQWSTERGRFFSTTTPNHMSHNRCFKNWTNWAMKFCLTRHIHLTSCQPTTTSSSISRTFWRKNSSAASRKQKMLSKISLNPKHEFLSYRNEQTYFLLAKMCWL